MRDDLIRALEDTIARPTCEFLRIDRKAAVELLALLQPQASEDAQPVGWLRAADEEMVCAHLGVADAEDSYETAKKKLASRSDPGAA